jgi:diguanylate cyclase (GGDEF)-like protein
LIKTGEEVGHATYLSKYFLKLLGAVIAVLLLFFAAERLHFQNILEKGEAMVERASQAQSKILLADQTLTMSAEAYALSAVPHMRERYDAAVPVIDAGIAEAKALASSEIANQLDAETRVANDRLIELEAKAFSLASRYQLAEASAVMNSQAYLENKKILAQGTDKFMASLKREIAQTKTRMANYSLLAGVGIASLCAMIFVLIWVRLRAALDMAERAFARAMTHMQLSEEMSFRAARLDALSDLPNRLHLVESLDRNLASGAQARSALLYIDLDGFKAVNDTYDHATGDALLCSISRGLAYLAGSESVLARLGGDEFAVLISDDTDVAAKAVRVAEQIIAFVKDPFEIDGRIANVGASIGICIPDQESLSVNEWMRRADVAMYDAKEHSRGHFRVFRPDLDEKRREDLALATELRAHVQQGKMGVVYQPMVDATTSRIIGVEALARWPAGSGKMVSPVDFIRIAEEHGIINALGRHIFELACNDLKAFPDLRLAINVSPVQLKNPHFVSELKDIAQKAGFDLARLEVELTETVLIKDPLRIKQVLRELRALGVTVALDDFGTGYASVGYLREFGFDKIKLDRSLTQAVLSNPSAQKVVQGTVLIAGSMCANIIAEGVETVEEYKLMHLLGCNQMQGYYFGRPQGLLTMSGLIEGHGIKEDPAAIAV